MRMVVVLYSLTTTREVIAALLSKFNITDNVMKFALYERTFDDSKQQLGMLTTSVTVSGIV